MELLVFLTSLFFFMIFGMPIAVVLILSAIMLMLFMGNFDPEIIGQRMVNGANNFPLMAIPFFILAGEIMFKGGLSHQIVEFSKVLIGRIKGGLGYVAVLASILLAGLSGSAVADAAILGAILIPLMAKQGYDRAKSTGLIASASIIAPIIPPSIPMIVLGATISGLSITKLFMAGIVPGIIIGIALMIAWFVIVKKDGLNDKYVYTKIEAKSIMIKAIPALFMPFLIIGGIRFGVFTPTEAGAFAVVYAFIIAVFWYKELKLRDLITVFSNTAKNSAIVMLIVSAASVIAWLITVAQIPNQAIDLFSPFIDSPLLLLLTINLFLLLVGMVMDLTPNILIFSPVLFPIIIEAGIDPYFFGIVLIFNLCLGLLTPPVGTILYLGSSIGGIKFGQMVKGVLPFLLTQFLILLLFIFFPQIILSPLDILAP